MLQFELPWSDLLVITVQSKSVLLSLKTVLISCYICQGGYIFTRVCLIVCLLTGLIVTVGLYRIVSGIKSDNCKIPPPVFLFHAPLRGFPWNFVTSVGFKKLEWCPYQVIKKVWRYAHLFRRSTGIGQTDGRTDGQTDRNTITISRICYDGHF